MTSNPFDYITSISSSKVNLMTDKYSEKEYNPFMVNRGLSYFIDTVLYANEMNMNYHVDSKLQYQYLINIVRPKKRFSKWSKKVNNDDLSLIMEYYGFNKDKAQTALRILTTEQIDVIKKKQETGGVKK